jgi:Raf kinase inhibitor-like YbhB/YbcL family protein
MNRSVRAVAGCFFTLLTVAPQAMAADFTLTSSGFKDGGVLALKNAGNKEGNANCVGKNISPALKWSNPPQGTQSFALMIFDTDGRNGLGVAHLVSYGIPATVTGFAEGEISQPSESYVGGKNTPGTSSYYGPCPPPGGWHHYAFTVIATDLDPKALAPGLTRDELFAALDKHAKAAATLVGRFKHPG